MLKKLCWSLLVISTLLKYVLYLNSISDITIFYYSGSSEVDFIVSTVQFDAGSESGTTECFEIMAREDNTLEEEETVTLMIESSYPGATIANNNYITVSIQDGPNDLQGG